MLLKWIICTVPEYRRAAFGDAQRSWRALTGVEGFLGQVGGWRVETPGEACILGLWRHHGAYQRFMREIHDTITGPTGQDSMYEAIHIELHDEMFTIPGSSATLAGQCEQATVLRVAECEVHSNRQSHFVCMQQEVWNPGLANHGAMLGGLFARSANHANRFLVTTWWRDRAGHDAYVDQALPGLRTEAAVDRDVRALEGRIIDLDPSWSVPATGSA